MKTSQLVFLFLTVLLVNPILLKYTIRNIINTKMIYFGGYYIFIREDDDNVYYYNESTEDKESLGRMMGIDYKKDIFVLDSNYFLIVGQRDSDKSFCYNVCEINDSSGSPKLSMHRNYCDISITIQKDRKFFISCESKSSCILSKIDTVNSHLDSLTLYEYDLEAKGFLSIIAIEDDNINYYSKKISSCAIQNRKFTCVLSGKIFGSGENFIVFIVYGNFRVPGKFYSIEMPDSDNYRNPSLISTDTPLKFAFCLYKYSTDKSNMNCGFITLNEDGNEAEVDFPYSYIYKEGGRSASDEEPLILKQYKNTIYFLHKTSTSSSVTGILFMSLFDFSIFIKADPLGGNYYNDISNFFIFEDKYSISYGFKSSIETYTTIETTELNKCDSTKEFIRFNKKKEEEILYLPYSPSDFALFQLNKKTKMYRGTDPFKGGLDNLYNTDADFRLKRPDSSGIISNYYAILGKESDEFYLIRSNFCTMTIVSCYDTCLECNLEKEGTSTSHQCLSCIDGYYPVEEEKYYDEKNCYDSKAPNVLNYYLDPETGLYQRCHSTCARCNNKSSCTKCKEGFFFKADRSFPTRPDETDICYQGLQEGYYLNPTANLISSLEENITLAYSLCFSTCKTCNFGGTISDHNCISCKDEYMIYPFSPGNCKKNYTDCIKEGKYWKMTDSNDVLCVDVCERTKGESVIVPGINKGQCVTDCQDYVNPFTIKQQSNLLTYKDNGKNFSECIEREECDDSCRMSDGVNCIKLSDECDPKNETIIEEPDVPPDDEEIEKKIEDIKGRAKFIKTFDDTLLTIDLILEKFRKDNGINFINEYYDILQKELKNYAGVYIVSINNYTNAIVTVYPFDIEDYAYEKVFYPYSLGFLNFTKLFPNFIKYEVKKKSFLLAVVMEYINPRSPTNDLNYFLYSINERNKTDTHFIDVTFPNQTFLEMNNDSIIEVSHPLKNYNSTVKIHKRNSVNLIQTLNKLGNDHPDIDFYNLSHPFFNDICYIFTTDVNTDMTINDRRKEYFVNASLCENTCQLKTVIEKNTTAPRSICECQIKEEFIFDNLTESEDEITNKSVANVHVVECVKETFNWNSLSSSLLFWVFLVIFLLHILIMLFTICLGPKEIQKRKKIYEKKQLRAERLAAEKEEEEDEEEEEYKISEKVIIGDIINNSINNNKDNNNTYVKEDGLIQEKEKENPNIKESINKSKEDLLKEEVKIDENNLINNRDESNQGKEVLKKKIKAKPKAKSKKKPKVKEQEKKKISLKDKNVTFIESRKEASASIIPALFTAPINPAGPPKKQGTGNSSKSEAKDDKEMVINMERSSIKASEIKLGPVNNFGISHESSIEDIENDFMMVNNYIPGGGQMMVNNYLRNPLEIERLQKIKKMKMSFVPLNYMDYAPYCHSCDDFLFPSQNHFDDVINNRDKKRIARFIDGLDIDKYRERDNLSESDHHPQIFSKKDEKKNTLLFEEEKGYIGDEAFYYHGSNELIDDTTLKNGIFGKTPGMYTKRKMAQSARQRKEMEKSEEEDKNMKTDFDHNVNNIIKNALINGDGTIILGKTQKRMANSDEKILEEKKEKKTKEKKTKEKKTGEIKPKEKKTKEKQTGEIKTKEKKVKPKKNRNKKNKVKQKELGSKRLLGNESLEREEEEEEEKEEEEEEDERSENVKKIGILEVSSSETTVSYNKKITIDDGFCRFYCEYFSRREIFLVTFLDRRNSAPIFIRLSLLLLILVFILCIDCLLYYESHVSKRYFYTLRNGERFGYYLVVKESLRFVYTALITNVFKILCVRLILYSCFMDKVKKIKKKENEENEEEKNKEEQVNEEGNVDNDINKNSKDKSKNKEALSISNKIEEEEPAKKETVGKCYEVCFILKILFFFIIVLALTAGFAYIILCYTTILPNSVDNILLGFVYSLLMSIIVCAILCFIIVSTYWLGKKTKNRCLISFYYVGKSLY